MAGAGAAFGPPAPRELFTALIDDAAVFPPGNAPMPAAVAAHAGFRAAWYADLVGPFLCPATRVAELRAALPTDAALAVSLIVDAPGEVAHSALRQIRADPRFTLVMVEARAVMLGDAVPAVGANLARLEGVRGYLELPVRGWDAVLDLVGGPGWYGAKFRTGGESADAFPTEAELAAFLVACVRRSLPFKLTAGLHHAVRHTDAGTGLEQHGVLNLLVALAGPASSYPGAGTGPDQVARVLASRDVEQLADALRSLDRAAAGAVRALWTSFGCCGVREPIEELVALGLLAEEAEGGGRDVAEGRS